MMEYSSDDPILRQVLDLRPGKAEVRKIAILEATIDCLHSLGIEETTFATVGKRAKMGRAHVAYYFKKREDLLQAAIRYVVGNAQRITVEHVARNADPRAQCLAMIEATCRWAEENPKQASVMMFLYYYAATKKEYRRLHTQIRDVGASRLEAMLRKGLRLADEEYRPLAKAMQAVMTGQILDQLTTDNPRPWPQTREHTIALVRELWDTRSTI